MESFDYNYISKSVTRGEICVLCLKGCLLLLRSFRISNWLKAAHPTRSCASMMTSSIVYGALDVIFPAPQTSKSLFQNSPFLGFLFACSKNPTRLGETGFLGT